MTRIIILFLPFNLVIFARPMSTIATVQTITLTFGQSSVTHEKRSWEWVERSFLNFFSAKNCPIFSALGRIFYWMKAPKNKHIWHLYNFPFLIEKERNVVHQVSATWLISTGRHCEKDVGRRALKWFGGILWMRNDVMAEFAEQCQLFSTRKRKEKSSSI